METSDWIAIGALLISVSAFFKDVVKDFFASENLKENNKVDLGRTISPAKYISEKNFNPFSDELEECYQLQIPYKIHNKGNNPLIIEKVFFVFQDPDTGKHIRTFVRDFSGGMIVIESKDSKPFSFPITFSDDQKVNEVYGLMVILRIEVRGYENHITFDPLKLEFEDPY